MLQRNFRSRLSILSRLFTIVLLLPTGVMAMDTIEVMLGSEAYRIELAVTAAERQRGLMQRAELGTNEGMLLVYPHSADHRIWMKNMLIPLRVYWLDADFEVIDEQRLEPCPADPCPIYAVDRDSHYVLELSDRPHALAPGDRLHGIRID